MANNEEIRIEGILRNSEVQIEKIRQMTDTQLEELEGVVKTKLSVVNERIDLVSVLSGRNISEKKYNHMVEMGVDELKESLKEGHTFDNKTAKRFDFKTEKVVEYQVYYSPESVMATQATKEIATDEEIEQIKYRLNKYEMRRENGIIHRNVLTNIKKSISLVRKEKLDAELTAKNVKNVSLGILGRKLMESMKVQPVRLPGEVQPVRQIEVPA